MIAPRGNAFLPRSPYATYSLGQATLVPLGYVTSFRLVELSVNNLSLDLSLNALGIANAQV